MSLIRWKPESELWDPFRSLEEIREEMNRIFDTSLRRRGSFWTDTFSPALDVIEEKDNFLIKVDLPGLTKDDISVTIHDSYLTIKGERRHEVEKKDANFYHRERSFGQFVRTLELPVHVDPAKVQATFRDGVLHVTVPKTEEAKPREIKVDVS